MAGLLYCSVSGQCSTGALARTGVLLVDQPRGEFIAGVVLDPHLEVGASKLISMPQPSGCGGGALADMEIT